MSYTRSAEMARRNSTASLPEELPNHAVLSSVQRPSAYGLPFVISAEGRILRRDGYVPNSQVSAPEKKPELRSEKEALGVYAIALYRGLIVLFPSAPENEGKLEAVGQHMALQPINLTDLEIVSGKVEPVFQENGGKVYEDGATALIREMFEERNLRTTQQQYTNSQASLEVRQIRDGKTVHFSVTGYTAELTDEQIQQLKEQAEKEKRTTFRTFSPLELLAALRAGEVQLRPAARVAVLRYLATLQLESGQTERIARQQQAVPELRHV